MDKDDEFFNLTTENLKTEHLCCIIRSRKPHEGVERKRKWLEARLNEGHIFRKLNKKEAVFIEYAPLEKAWVPVNGDNYFYIYCLWANGQYKGKGYGKALLEYCINDAKEKGKSGICALGSKKQKGWLTDQNFLKSFGFKKVDETTSGYELLALSFDGTYVKFNDCAKKEQIDNKELTIYYDYQCPYILQSIDNVKNYCEVNSIKVKFIEVDTLNKAKTLPCVFNNYAVFYDGRFKTVNLTLDTKVLERMIKK